MRLLQRAAAALMAWACGCTLAGDFNSPLLQVRKVAEPAGAHSIHAVAEREGEAWTVSALYIFTSQLTDADLKRISLLTTLRSVEIRGTGETFQATDTAWRSLKSLASLQKLALASQTAEGVLLALEGLPSLESLDLSECSQVTDAALAHLKAFRRLRNLKLPNALHEQAVSYVLPLKGLEHLKLASGFISDTALCGLRTLAELRSLDVAYVGVKSQAALKELPHLESLTVYGHGSAAPSLDMSQWVRLKSLTLGDGFITGSVELPAKLQVARVRGWNAKEAKAGGFHVAEPMPKTLERLYLITGSGCRAEKRAPADLAWLTSLPKLKDLTVENPTRADLAFLAESIHVSALALTGHGEVLVDEDMKTLASMSQLEALLIQEAGGDVSDVGIDALARLKALRRLELRWFPKMTPVGLASLWRLTGLEALSIGLPTGFLGVELEKQMAGISALSQLRELSLRGQLTDKALRSLANLKKLNRLDLSGCHGFTEDGLIALVNALPELREVKWSYAPPPAPKNPGKGDDGAVE